MANEYGYENNLNKLTPSDVYRPGVTSEDGLPSVGVNDNGKVLIVDNGEWTVNGPVYK